MIGRWRLPLAFVALLALSAGAGWLYGTLRHDSGTDTATPRRVATLRSGPRQQPTAAVQPGHLDTTAASPEVHSSPPPVRESEAPLSGTVISVDPGHNGGNATHPEEIDRPVVAYADGSTKPCNTTGTETDDGSLTEAEFNLDVALQLRRRLRDLGATVVMTRTNNEGVGPCVNERAEFANRAHADAAISIHADGNLEEGARGFDVIHPATDELVHPQIAGPSLALAEQLRNALAAGGAPIANYVGEHGLDARDDLGGLNLSAVPAVLVELGNMRSAQEAPRLESPSYRSRLADALAVGLLGFLSNATGTGD